PLSPTRRSSDLGVRLATPSHTDSSLTLGMTKSPTIHIDSRRRRADSGRREDVQSLPHLHASAARSELPRLAHAAAGAVDADSLALATCSIASFPLVIDPHRKPADVNRSDELQRDRTGTGVRPRLCHDADASDGTHLRG